MQAADYLCTASPCACVAVHRLEQGLDCGNGGAGCLMYDDIVCIVPLLLQIHSQPGQPSEKPLQAHIRLILNLGAATFKSCSSASRFWAQVPSF